ncbi:hypothetical protein [Flavobacterium suncheonense]|uniref:Uncharacterized protein n=1 Tax=Flavobacterium suncheonense GH29-5 = DSM 17707 TaxID=1121899 RepID=A0A0A2MQ78_9FLAO|nr:hypothetical protein [Flavobacterium suncheonense]KGO90435.1 hypothetical protein Q764_02465 [Flavobacterium suncheonense GH29-5 = DSM 17707]
MYSLNRITTTADCDVLLTWANKEKEDLAHKRYTEQRFTTTYSTASIEIEAVLQGVLTEIAAEENIIGVLPEGRQKEEHVKKKIRLEYKKFLLENRKESYGVVALLENELDLERLNKEIDEVDAFIAAITAHRNTL